MPYCVFNRGIEVGGERERGFRTGRPVAGEEGDRREQGQRALAGPMMIECRRGRPPTPSRMARGTGLVSQTRERRCDGCGEGKEGRATPRTNLLTFWGDGHCQPLRTTRQLPLRAHSGADLRLVRSASSCNFQQTGSGGPTLNSQSFRLQTTLGWFGQLSDSSDRVAARQSYCQDKSLVSRISLAINFVKWLAGGG